LPPGTQACQAAHSALDFAIAYPAVTGDWHASSNTLVVLAAPDELSLGWLCDDAAAAGLRVVRFHEPDLGGALTAAALEPAAARLISRLPLALAPGDSSASPSPSRRERR
jgi:hypothetical protein